MSIRKVKKDHLPEHASLELVQPILEMPVFTEDPLKFWTVHPDETQRVYVDLTKFAVGKEKRMWNEIPFTGRPQLIRQLSPIIQQLTTGSMKLTAHHLVTQTAKLWWTLDEVEKAAEKAGQHMDRVEDVRQIAEFHRELLFRDCTQTQFNAVLRVLNAARAMLGVTPLHWAAPEVKKPDRHLPDEDQSNDIRHALRHEWLAAHRRRQLYEEIQSEGFEPHEMQDVSIEEQQRLLHNWRHYLKIQQETGKASLSAEELSGEKERRKRDSFLAKNVLSPPSMRQIAHPTRWEAAAAIHQCLAVTGWNSAVLESLDVTDPYFLVDHPRDEKRYLLTGTKARARGEEMLAGGLWKTQAGPGYIIKTWLERTAPLRKQLQVELSLAREKYAQMQKEGASGKDLTKPLKEIQRLQIAVKSVWIFVDSLNGSISSWGMGSDNFPVGKKNTRKKRTYLEAIVECINNNRATHSKMPITVKVNTSDLRDMFAFYVYRTTGGNLLALLRALGHKRLSTTERYVDNNILNAERDGQASKFQNNLFAELARGRLDITILAHLQRYGKVTEEQEKRLMEFRVLQRSRMGVGCRDPRNPPAGVSANRNGSQKGRNCTGQRCLLCKENSVILPESMTGIAMRTEELLVIQTEVSFMNWGLSDFDDELQNCLDALQLFDAAKVEKARIEWAQKIANGTHPVPGLPMIKIQEEA